MMRDIIDQAKDIFSQKIIRYLNGKRWKDAMSELAVSDCTLSRWRRKEGLPTKKKFEEVKIKIPFRENEVQIIAKAIARTMSLRVTKAVQSRYGSRENFRASEAPETKTTVEERLEKIERRLQAMEGCTPRDVQALSVVPRKKSQNYIGEIKSPNWDAEGMRFVLTKENFRAMDSGAWSPEEIIDTCKLIEEIRRRLILLAQNPRDDVREDHLRKMAKELDELWRAYQAARSVAPFEVLDIIELERKRFLSS